MKSNENKRKQTARQVENKVSWMEDRMNSETGRMISETDRMISDTNRMNKSETDIIHGKKDSVSNDEARIP